jgi:SulP family sulfate permease
MQFVNGLHFNNLRGDIYSGLTVAAVVALPLALGVASGTGAIAGIYGAIFVGFFAALFGCAPAQASGPTGPMTVVMALIFTQYTSLFPDNPAAGAAMAFTVVIMGGLFQILFGLLRIGKYIEFVPHPVVSGFMSGIGVIIILNQIGPVLGVTSSPRPLEAAMAIPEVISHAHQASVILGIIALIIVYGIPKFLPQVNKLVPSPLLTLAVGTMVYITMMGDSGAPIIGDIPTGIPSVIMPNLMLEYLPDMIKSALILAALGAIDSPLTSLVADNITRTYHKSDRELIGQGIGNTVAGFFGGLPGAGATMVNVKAGVVMMVTVLLMTVFVDLIMAVAVGMVMVSFIFMKRMTDLQLKNAIATTRVTEELPLNEEEQAIMETANGQDHGRKAFLECQGVIANLTEGHCLQNRLEALRLVAEKLPTLHQNRQPGRYNRLLSTIMKV